MRFGEVSTDYLMTRLGAAGLQKIKLIGNPANAMVVTVNAALPRTQCGGEDDSERVSSVDVLIHEKDGKLEFCIEKPAPSEVMHPNWNGSGYWCDPMVSSYQLLDNSSFCGILERMIGSLNFADGCWVPDKPVNRNAAAWCKKHIKTQNKISIKRINKQSVNAVENDPGKESLNTGNNADAIRKKPVLHIAPKRKPASEERNEEPAARSNKSENPITLTSGKNSSGDNTIRIIRINYAALDQISASRSVTLEKERILKTAAQTFVRGIKARLSEIVIPTKVDFNELISYVHTERPELYELETLNYAIRTGVNNLTILPEYGLDEQQTKQIRERTDRGIEAVAAEAAKLPYGFEQLRYIYYYISSHAVYTPNKPFPWFSYSAAGVFTRNTAVCSGFAKSYMLIAKKLGYNVKYVIGSISGNAEGGHAWNLVELNGYTYHVDVTGGVNLYKRAHICALPCFMMTTKEIRRSRIIKTPFVERDDPKGSYLVQKGYSFSTADELLRLIGAFARSEQPIITFQASSDLIGTDRFERTIKGSMDAVSATATVHYSYAGTVVFVKKNMAGIDKLISKK